MSLDQLRVFPKVQADVTGLVVKAASLLSACLIFTSRVLVNQICGDKWKHRFYKEIASIITILYDLVMTVILMLVLLEQMLHSVLDAVQAIEHLISLTLENVYGWPPILAKILLVEKNELLLVDARPRLDLAREAIVTM